VGIGITEGQVFVNDPWAGFLVSSVAWQRLPHGEAIPQVQAAGFGGVEILCKPGHFEPDNQAHVDEVVAALSEWPDADVTFHAPFYNVDLSSPESETWEHAMREMMRALDAALALRAQNVTLHARGREQAQVPWTDANPPAFRRALGQLAEVAEERKMTLSVENMPPPRFTFHEDELLGLLEGFPPHVVGVCIDTGHAHLAGRLVELAQALAPRALVSHLHDNSAIGKDEHRIPGQGTIPWRELVDAFQVRGFRGWRVVEVVMVESLGKTLDMLKESIIETGLSELIREEVG
jgi:sugar phosphate isomerase/epimerase